MKQTRKTALFIGGVSIGVVGTGIGRKRRVRSYWVDDLAAYRERRIAMMRKIQQLDREIANLERMGLDTTEAQDRLRSLSAEMSNHRLRKA